MCNLFSLHEAVTVLPRAGSDERMNESVAASGSLKAAVVRDDSNDIGAVRGSLVGGLPGFNVLLAATAPRMEVTRG